MTAINEPGHARRDRHSDGSENGANIDNVTMEPISKDQRSITLDVEVTDLKHLSTIVSQLRARPTVSKVERING